MQADVLARSLRSQIADRLRDDVLCGRIESGRFLRQEELVSRFGVSHTPVREALIQLTNEGLLEAIPNTGVKVRCQPPDHIREFLTPMRRSIEVYALRLCFDDLNAADFQLWDSILDKLQMACERRDYAAMAEQEIAFHRLVVRRANEPTLVNLWSAVLSQFVAYVRHWHLLYADPLDNFREHKQIIDLFRTGDKEASINLYSAMIGADELVRQDIANGNPATKRDALSGDRST
jgi:DNA-binding GntR family transcriptional regulator